jgi:hypothetical protein
MIEIPSIGSEPYHADIAGRMNLVAQPSDDDRFLYQRVSPAHDIVTDKETQHDYVWVKFHAIDFHQMGFLRRTPS